MRKTPITWTVGYRTGGTDNFEWHRTIAFLSKDKAMEAAINCKNMGYPAHVYKTAQLDAIGLPNTFDTEGE